MNVVSVVQIDENARRERLTWTDDIVRAFPVSVPGDVNAVGEVRFCDDAKVVEQARLDDFIGVDGDGIVEPEFNGPRVSSLPVAVFFVPVPGEDCSFVFFSDLNGLLPVF